MQLVTGTNCAPLMQLGTGTNCALFVVFLLYLPAAKQEEQNQRANGACPQLHAVA